jgi:Arc/MetJ family transcription regulator
MVKRTTIELDEDLLERAKKTLGRGTARATIEEALRRAVDAAEREGADRRSRQARYLASLSVQGDPGVLKSDEMWR